jgi:hypothetical protein
LRPVAHELTHVNERSRYRVIIQLGVGYPKVSWFGRGVRPRARKSSNSCNEIASSHGLPQNAGLHYIWTFKHRPSKQKFATSDMERKSEFACEILS